MRKKQTPEETESRRKMILETAYRLLMEEEYRGITIRRITAECSMATGTFFNYFPSKETLFLTLLYGKSAEYFQSELERLQEAAPHSLDDYIQFMTDGARDMIDNRQDLISLIILHHELLTSASPEGVPKEANTRYILSMTDLADAVHRYVPEISAGEALRNYSFMHAQIIGSGHIAPISGLNAYYPAWFDVDTEIMRAMKRYLKGVKEELQSE